MDIFNKIGKKASETYKVTAEKTSKIAKEAKLRMKMNENKSDIEDLYKQIGKKVYEKHLTDESININDLLEDEVTKIDVLSDEIENFLKEIMSLKDLKQCPNCYEKIDKLAKYCSNCGAHQDKNDFDIKDKSKTEEKDVESDTSKEAEIIEETIREDKTEANNVQEAHEMADQAEEAKKENIYEAQEEISEESAKEVEIIDSDSVKFHNNEEG